MNQKAMDMAETRSIASGGCYCDLHPLECEAAGHPTQQRDAPTALEIITEAHRLFDKQRSEPHGEMMPLWEKTSIPIREAWIAVAKQRLDLLAQRRL